MFHPAAPVAAAGGATDSRSQVDCVFFLKGYCQNGAACAFKHDEAKRVQQDLARARAQLQAQRSKADTDCVYFLRGFCARGDACQYKHDQSKLIPKVRLDAALPSSGPVQPFVERPTLVDPLAAAGPVTAAQLLLQQLAQQQQHTSEPQLAAQQQPQPRSNEHAEAPVGREAARDAAKRKGSPVLEAHGRDAPRRRLHGHHEPVAEQRPGQREHRPRNLEQQRHPLELRSGQHERQPGHHEQPRRHHEPPSRHHDPHQRYQEARPHHHEGPPPVRGPPEAEPRLPDRLAKRLGGAVEPGLASGAPKLERRGVFERLGGRVEGQPDGRRGEQQQERQQHREREVEREQQHREREVEREQHELKRGRLGREAKHQQVAQRTTGLPRLAQAALVQAAVGEQPAVGRPGRRRVGSGPEERGELQQPPQQERGSRAVVKQQEHQQPNPAVLTVRRTSPVNKTATRTASPPACSGEEPTENAAAGGNKLQTTRGLGADARKKASAAPAEPQPVKFTAPKSREQIRKEKEAAKAAAASGSGSQQHPDAAVPAAKAPAAAKSPAKRAPALHVQEAVEGEHPGKAQEEAQLPQERQEAAVLARQHQPYEEVAELEGEAAVEPETVPQEENLEEFDFELDEDDVAALEAAEDEDLDLGEDAEF